MLYYIFSKMSSVNNGRFRVLRIGAYDLIGVAAGIKMGLVCSARCLWVGETCIHFLDKCFEVTINDERYSHFFVKVFKP